MREKGTLYLNMLHLILHREDLCQAQAHRSETHWTKRASVQAVYPIDDTPVAEEITRARVPASATAITRGGEDLPWHLLQSLHGLKDAELSVIDTQGL